MSVTELAVEVNGKSKVHPPGTIIVGAGEFLRFGSFVNSMLQVLHPPRTQILIKQSMAVVDNHNNCIQRMSDESEWVWIQADDHCWDPDALIKLLDREVDVVVPLILKRNPPYHPVAFKSFEPGQGYMPFSLSELPGEGLVKLHSAGSGGMLIRRHVLEAVGEPLDVPWNERYWFTYGATRHMNEDLVLCQRMTEAGFDIWLDVEVQFGHSGSFVVQPVYEDGRWSIGLNMGQSSNGKSNTLVIQPKE